MFYDNKIKGQEGNIERIKQLEASATNSKRSILPAQISNLNKLKEEKDQRIDNLNKVEISSQKNLISLNFINII